MLENSSVKIHIDCQLQSKHSTLKSLADSDCVLKGIGQAALDTMANNSATYADATHSVKQGTKHVLLPQPPASAVCASV